MVSLRSFGQGILVIKKGILPGSEHDHPQTPSHLHFRPLEQSSLVVQADGHCRPRKNISLKLRLGQSKNGTNCCRYHRFKNMCLGALKYSEYFRTSSEDRINRRLERPFKYFNHCFLQVIVIHTVQHITDKQNFLMWNKTAIFFFFLSYEVFKS